MKQHQWAYQQYGWTDLTPANRLVFENIEMNVMPLRRNLKILMEAELSQNQIEQMFKYAEDISRQKGYKTGFGKAASLPKEAMSKVNGVLGKFGTELQNSAPVKAFDQKFDELKDKIKTKLGSSKKGQDFVIFIEQLGSAAKANPVWQSAIIGLLVAGSSLLLGPASIPVVGFLLKGAAELIKGEKLSTAIGKGVKTAAFGYLAGHVIGSIVSWAQGLHVVANTIAPDVVKVTIDASQNLHGIASKFHLSDVVMTVADKAKLDKLILDFGDPSHIGSAYKNLLNFSKHLASPEYVSQLAQQAGTAAVNQASQAAFANSVQNIGAVIQAAAGGAASAAGAKDLKETRQLPRAVMEGMWADLTLKFGAGKLNKTWIKAGRPTDSVDIAEMLANMGMDNDDIGELMTKSGLSPDDVSATLKGLATLGDDEGLEAPFVSGIEDLDNEAKKILKTQGEKAFDDFWKAKLQELEKKVSPATPPATPPDPAAAAAALATDLRNGIAAAIPPAKKTRTGGKQPGQVSQTQNAKQKRAARAAAKAKLSESIDRKLAAINEILSIIRENKLSNRSRKIKIKALLEYASGGSTSAGNIGSIPGTGGPMMPVIRRMPAGQSFFGPAGTLPAEQNQKRRKTKGKRSSKSNVT